jgi:hypothetical protein
MGIPFNGSGSFVKDNRGRNVLGHHAASRVQDAVLCDIKRCNKNLVKANCVVVAEVYGKYISLSQVRSGYSGFCRGLC